MSYCRFSSDNWKSDVYAYRDCGGNYVVHVAARRINGVVPMLPNVLKVGADVLAEAVSQQRIFIDTCTRSEIGLKYDGEHFEAETLPELRDILLMLRAEGYSVPNGALAEIEDEIKELNLP